MEENKVKPNNQRKKFIAFILFPIIIIIGAVALFFYREYKSTHLSTDDAFVDGRVHAIASKISGTVKVIHVKDNQFVKKGSPILEIDPIDYEVRVKEAQAGFETERAKLSEIRDKVDTAKKQLTGIIASMEEARANLELQEANLRQAEVDFKRAESLLKKEVIPREQYDKAKTSYDVAAAQVKAARERIKQLEASLETQKAVIKQTETSLIPQQAQIQQKEATLKGVELSKSYTIIYSPSDGYIAKKSVEIGNQIQPGQSLMAVVPLNDIWITANYKETQLGRVKPGQKVKIIVDTYPGKVFYGKVESVQAGTGAVFSLFPPENATGNYVKIVQRIPVKIILDQGTDPSHNLRIGMSVEPTILVNSK
ncbi:MAG: HlyD family secretion protein [Deltaproteobacteria bacterium CG03_land_8_20_14_0_80_45_14]|nr:MAG: HlyD family secretion protein [Deltaproteobacteria bacterium CG03_land_8_20_14_0_80_45_14]